MAKAQVLIQALVRSLQSPPAILQSIVGGIDDRSDFWDLVPEEGRFSAREVLAHIVDWNRIFLERIRLTVEKYNPTIVPIDEDQLAIDHAYSEQNPVDSMHRFFEGRVELVQYVSEIPEDDWERTAYREDMGTLTIMDLVVLVTIHDSYHVKQIAEYSDAWHSQND